MRARVCESLGCARAALHRMKRTLSSTYKAPNNPSTHSLTPTLLSTTLSLRRPHDHSHTDTTSSLTLTHSHDDHHTQHLHKHAHTCTRPTTAHAPSQTELKTLKVHLNVLKEQLQEKTEALKQYEKDGSNRLNESFECEL